MQQTPHLTSGGRTTGVVLAGGQSARMGRSKAALEISGEPLVRRVVGRLQQAVAEVLVVGPHELLAQLVPGIHILPDLRPGLGPLSGLEAALSAVSTPYVFVIACDMPFVAPALVRYLAELAETMPHSDVVAPRGATGLEYLHAVYRVACLSSVRAQLDAGERSVYALLQRLRVSEVDLASVVHLDPSGLSCFNANTPEEWTYALALAAANDPEASA